VNFNVTKQRSLWWGVSLAVIVGGLIAMVISWTQIQYPLRPSLDFIGGTRLQFELACPQSTACQPIQTAEVREVLQELGLGSSSIQVLGNELRAVSIRSQPLNVEERTRLQTALSQRLGAFDPQKTQIDTVGPTLGRQLLTKGLLALLVSFLGILIYLTIRFQLDYAVFAFIALVHDVLVTAGVFAVLGLVQGVEVDSLFIVALLTIIGFSVNDTVVIYDRVRENLNLAPERSISETVDAAVSQTLARSINTSLTTMLPLVAIFLFGGTTLKYFALALLVGFAAGAYSSIFVASTLLAWWRERTASGREAPLSS